MLGNSLPSEKSQVELDQARTSTTNSFRERLHHSGLPTLRRSQIETLQVNIGLRCNLACHHCHVESGPKRNEALSRAGCDRILELLKCNPRVTSLDITGGAPELHPDFQFLVRGARALGRRVIDRCNLTVLFEPGQEKTAEFLAEQGVDIIASLPCYSLENVEAQRGRGVFNGSISALQELNALGYGQPNSALQLDLVYNPVGAFLPPSQESLNTSYRKELGEQFGIQFNRLLTITNMPIKRFAHELLRDGQYKSYLRLLVDHFNEDNVEGLMCRNQISIGHDGTLYDCDFNQALEILPVGPRRTIFDVEDFNSLVDEEISTADHCFGCTAGTGSSCGGSLS